MRHGRVRHRINELGAVANDAALLGLRADHETRDVVQEHKRRVRLVAELDELRTLLGLLRKEDAVVAEHADGEAVNRRPAADEFVSVQGLELFEAAAVKESGVNLANIEGNTHISRGATQQFSRVIDRFVRGFGRTRAELLPLQMLHDLAGDAERIHFVLG